MDSFDLSDLAAASHQSLLFGSYPQPSTVKRQQVSLGLSIWSHKAPLPYFHPIPFSCSDVPLTHPHDVPLRLCVCGLVVLLQLVGATLPPNYLVPHYPAETWAKTLFLYNDTILCVSLDLPIASNTSCHRHILLPSPRLSTTP